MSLSGKQWHNANSKALRLAIFFMKTLRFLYKKFVKSLCFVYSTETPASRWSPEEAQTIGLIAALFSVSEKFTARIRTRRLMMHSSRAPLTSWPTAFRWIFVGSSYLPSKPFCHPDYAWAPAETANTQRTSPNAPIEVNWCVASRGTVVPLLSLFLIVRPAWGELQLVRTRRLLANLNPKVSFLRGCLCGAVEVIHNCILQALPFK